MRIGILGGSFNPPRLGHLLIASQVKEFLELDVMWLLPCYQHAFDKTLIDAQHRLAMTKLLENSFIKVNDFELKQKQVNYTIDTLEHMKKTYPQDMFYWITGSDQLKSFHKYKRWEELIKNFNLVIFPREAMLPDIEKQVKKYLKLRTIPENITMLNFPGIALTNISSTMIRENVASGQSIHYLVPEKVETYIMKHNLYQI